jgi:hypothetical protein
MSDVSYQRIITEQNQRNNQPNKPLNFKTSTIPDQIKQSHSNEH